MLDVGWQEMLLIAVVAVVVIGPKDLPVAIKTVAQWVKKAREMAGEFQRVIPITTRPHLPSSVRQWWGDSRGHWEGDTLVVDVTNFTPKKAALRGSFSLPVSAATTLSA